MPIVDPLLPIAIPYYLYTPGNPDTLDSISTFGSPFLERSMTHLGQRIRRIPQRYQLPSKSWPMMFFPQMGDELGGGNGCATSDVDLGIALDRGLRIMKKSAGKPYANPLALLELQEGVPLLSSLSRAKNRAKHWNFRELGLLSHGER